MEHEYQYVSVISSFRKYNRSYHIKDPCNKFKNNFSYINTHINTYQNCIITNLSYVWHVLIEYLFNCYDNFYRHIVEAHGPAGRSDHRHRQRAEGGAVFFFIFFQPKNIFLLRRKHGCSWKTKIMVVGFDVCFRKLFMVDTEQYVFSSRFCYCMFFFFRHGKIKMLPAISAIWTSSGPGVQAHAHFAGEATHGVQGSSAAGLLCWASQKIRRSTAIWQWKTWTNNGESTIVFYRWSFFSLFRKTECVSHFEFFFGHISTLRSSNRWTEFFRSGDSRTTWRWKMRSSPKEAVQKTSPDNFSSTWSRFLFENTWVLKCCFLFF